MLTAMSCCPEFRVIVDCASLTCQNMQMTADEPLILYSRENCHLCELAVTMLEQAGVGWRRVDIDEDRELVSRYGNHVPVLLHQGSGRELFFPFTKDQIVSF